jgi:ketosteroid isomerase-like protein
MKRTPIITALVLSAVSSAIAQQKSARPQDASSAERAIQQQDQERIRAQIAADTVALRRIYADDFLGIGPTGVVRNKAAVIADFTSHALTYQSITTAEVRVRVYGNTAVETGRSTMVAQDKGKAVPRENRFTRVWVMTAGRWQLVANHYYRTRHRVVCGLTSAEVCRAE